MSEASGKPGPQAGLCDVCAHQQVVRNTRGSVFSLCRRSREDPGTYVRYPPLPVRACGGFAPRAAQAPGSRAPAASDGGC